MDLRTVVSTPSLCAAKSAIITIQALSSVITPCNSWLLFLRVCAIPSQMMSRFMMLTFTALWGLTFTSFLVFLGVRVVQVSSSMEICEMQINTRVLAVPFIVLAIFDTVSTIAISLGLTKFAPVTTWTERVETVVTLRSMGRISRSLLRSGWIYYV